MSGSNRKSRTDRMLDSSIAMALACAGTYRCSNLTKTEKRELERKIDKLCRAATEDTCETKSWREYMAPNLLDDEETVVTWGSLTSSKLNEQKALLGDIPMWIGSGIQGNDEYINRKEHVEIILHTIQREETGHKTMPQWIPLLKNKLVKIIRKHNLTAGEPLRPLQTDKPVTADKALTRRERSILTKLALHMKSTNMKSSSSTKNVSAQTVPATSRRETAYEESEMDGFEIHRVATNYVSIIDPSLLLSDEKPRSLGEATPLVATKSVNEEGKEEDEMGALPLNKFSIRTFDASDLLMPSIQASKQNVNDETKSDDDCDSDEFNVSLLPKPVGFFNFLYEEASQEDTFDSRPKHAKGSLMQAQSEMARKALDSKNGKEGQHPDDVVLVEETICNREDANFEVTCTYCAPFEMSQSIEKQ